MTAAPVRPTVLVEACVDDVDAAVAAAAAGAGRIELCANLAEGGTTPSAGTVVLARERLRERLKVPLFVFVRPRGGDFLYDASEIETMCHDVHFARAAGADGVVIGALTADGAVDAPAVRALVDAAGPLEVTFHRAFDVVRDQADALEQLVVLGVRRVLTAGGAPDAVTGAPAIAGLVRQAGGRLTVMAGGGVRAENVAALVAATGVREVHLRAAVPLESAMRYRRPELAFRRPLPPDEYTREATSAAAIRGVVAACQAVSAGDL